MKNDELGGSLKKLMRDTVRDELANERKKQEKILFDKIDKHISEFDARLEKLEFRFNKETDVLKGLLEKNKLEQEPLWRKFTEEVVNEARKEIEEANDKKKTVNFKRILKRLDEVLDFIASDK
jgi:hypothetical protein